MCIRLVYLSNILHVTAENTPKFGGIETLLDLTCLCEYPVPVYANYSIQNLS